MKITSSYSVEVLRAKRIFEPTVRIYRKALSFLVETFHQEWETLAAARNSIEQFHMAEKLIHSTRGNEARYGFDQQFPKFPSYLRRAAIQAALGSVSSYQSNHQRWVQAGRQGKEPRLQAVRRDMPVFYNKEMYRETEDAGAGYVKLLVQHDWKFVKIDFCKTDINYLGKYWSDQKASAPKLEKRYGKYYLRFAYDERVTLSKSPVSQQRLCSVHLGDAHDAVCCIMQPDGTVLARKFLDFPSEKDQLLTAVHRCRRLYRERKPQSAQTLSAYVWRLNEELTRKIAHGITEFAASQSADCIVFAHTNASDNQFVRGVPQKLYVTRKKSIQEYVTHRAHRYGIRCSTVCPVLAAATAYDGSGPLSPLSDAVCQFPTGKTYDLSLNACYNIGARYFIRELLKSLPERVRSRLEAEVPRVGRRTSCTLYTLWSVHAALFPA